MFTVLGTAVHSETEVKPLVRLYHIPVSVWGIHFVVGADTYWIQCDCWGVDCRVGYGWIA